MNVLNIYNELDSHNFDLNVDHYGAEQCDKGYSFGPTIRDNFVLHFITKEEEKFLLTEKQAILLQVICLFCQRMFPFSIKLMI